MTPSTFDGYEEDLDPYVFPNPKDHRRFTYLYAPD